MTTLLLQLVPALQSICSGLETTQTSGLNQKDSSPIALILKVVTT